MAGGGGGCNCTSAGTLRGGPFQLELHHLGEVEGSLRGPQGRVTRTSV